MTCRSGLNEDLRRDIPVLRKVRRDGRCLDGCWKTNPHDSSQGCRDPGASWPARQTLFSAQIFESSSRPQVEDVPVQQRREPVDESLQKLPRILIGDHPVCIDQARLEGDVGLPAHDEDTQVSQNLTQVRLRHGCPKRTGATFRDPQGYWTGLAAR